MSPEQGRIVYDHVRATQPAEVLELGTAPRHEPGVDTPVALPRETCWAYREEAG